MTDWVQRQVDLLRAQWPNLSYVDDGHWVLVPSWELPAGWTPTSVSVAFQIKPAVDQPPYAFYVDSADIKHDGKVPGNWQLAAGVPFAGTWSMFSWSPETWVPTANPDHGPNMLAFAQSFGMRFAEGA